jgi:hypothetical protein
MMKDMGGLMRQAKEMQEKLKKAQKELEKETVVGSAGGVVEVTMTGNQRVTGVVLDSEKVKDISAERLQSLIAQAVNDALDRSRKLMANKIGPLGGGLGGLKF